MKLTYIGDSSTCFTHGLEYEQIESEGSDGYIAVIDNDGDDVYVKRICFE